MPSDYQIVDAMSNYGGSFVRALGYAFRCADEINQRRLKQAFPEYWDQYRKLAESEARRAAGRSTKA